jgi:DNA repair exonuclease SbcCD ATPase subunit
MNNKNNREVILIESSPKCLFYISKCNLNPIENLPKDYLDNYLRSKEELEINLIKDSMIKFFPDRDCIFDNQENVFPLLKNKIMRDLHSKNIRGKLFDGKSLVYFLKEYSKILSKGQNPNFDSLWNNVIKNDINEFKNNALNSYNKNLLSLNDNLNEEELIKSLYNFKVDAMDKLNDIFKINVDTFNNNEYLSWFNEVKRELEEKIEENEEKKININNETINQFNKKLLNENYQTIKDKVNKKYYNSSNINEYLKDYEDFINEYNKKGLGNNKLKILIDFITENKPDFIQKFMNELENENVEKLKEVNKKLEENNELKKNAEEEFKELNDKTDENSKKIEDLNSAIEKKKRQIKTLNEEIERVENDMKKARKEDVSTDKINTNNTNQSMNESNNDLSRNQKI